MTEAAVVGWGQAGVGGTLRVSSWPKNVLTALSCACTTIVYRMMAEVVLEMPDHPAWMVVEAHVEADPVDTIICDTPEDTAPGGVPMCEDLLSSRC